MLDFYSLHRDATVFPDPEVRAMHPARVLDGCG